MCFAYEYILRIIVIDGKVVFHVKAPGVTDIVKENGKHYFSFYSSRPVYEIDKA